MCYEGALEKLKKYPFSCKIAVMMKWSNISDFTCSVIIDFMFSDILDKRHLVSHLWDHSIELSLHYILMVKVLLLSPPSSSSVFQDTPRINSRRLIHSME